MSEYLVGDAVDVMLDEPAESFDVCVLDDAAREAYRDRRGVVP